MRTSIFSSILIDCIIFQINWEKKKENQKKKEKKKKWRKEFLCSPQLSTLYTAPMLNRG